MKYISNNIRWRAVIKGAERVETPEVPIEAVREIVVNSFTHMRINDVSSNEIYITPTRIHIYNPGSLVPGTDPMMFAKGEQGSLIRNPLITSVLYYNKTIDAFGTGFERVFSICDKGMYKYSSNQFGFTFEFIRSQLDTINGTINDSVKLSEAELKIIDILRDGNKYNKSQMTKIINKSEATVSRAINHLLGIGKIVRVGSNKTGYWRIIEVLPLSSTN